MKKKLDFILNNDLSKEFFKFSIVGIFNTLLNYGVFLLLLQIFQVQYLISGAIGYLSGAVSGYILNKIWTFKSDIPFLAGGIKYFLIQLFCLGINLLILHIAKQYFMCPERYTQLAGIIVTTILNFTASRKLVFK